MIDVNAFWKSAKTAIAEKRWDDAATVLDLALGGDTASLRVRFLQLATEVAVKRRDWGRAAAFAREFLALDMAGGPPADSALFVHIFELLRRALEESGDAKLIPEDYARIRPALLAIVQDPARAPETVSHTHYLSVILSQGDVELGRKWQMKRHPELTQLKRQPMAISPVRKLADGCAGVTVGILEPPQHITLRNGGFAYESASEAYRVAVVAGGELVSGWDFAVTAAGEVLGDSAAMKASLGWFPCGIDDSLGRALHVWPERSADIDADVLFLHGSPRFHVGHWFIDYLPRLRARKPGVKIGIPTELPDKHRALLALCGVADGDIITCDLGKRVRFRNIHVALPGSLYTPSPQTSRFLIEHLGPAAPLPPRQRRLFLHRGVASRRTANQAEVLRLLQDRGFEIMDLAETSVAGQRAALAEADIVVCTYGSDPIGVLFMQAGADVIEFRYSSDLLPIEQLNNCTDTWFNLIGVNYHVMDCPVAEDPGAARHKKDRDFTVDCAALAALLDAVAARKARGAERQSPFTLQADDNIPEDLPPGTSRTTFFR